MKQKKEPGLKCLCKALTKHKYLLFPESLYHFRCSILIHAGSLADDLYRFIHSPFPFLALCNKAAAYMIQYHILIF